VKFGHAGALLLALFVFSEGGRGVLQELPLPFGDHGRMNVKTFGDLDDRLFTFDGF